MKKLIVVALVLLLTGNLSPALAQGDPEGYPLVTIPNTQVRSIHSEIIGQDYTLYVALPNSYADSSNTYPVLYSMGGDIGFGTLTEAIRLPTYLEELPELIYVFVAYPDGDEAWSRDVTTPDGSENFIRFLNEELFPLIDSEYRTDPSDRAIHGHSILGVFILYTLIHHPETFNRYLVSSPSLWWDDGVIFEYEAEYAANHPDLRARLFLSVGTLQDVEGVDSLAERLASRNYRGLSITMITIEDATHLTAFPIAMIRGLNALYCWTTSGCSTPLAILQPVDDPAYSPGTTLTTPGRWIGLTTWPQIQLLAGTCLHETEAVVLQVVETSDGEIWLEVECDTATGWAMASRWGE